MSQLTGHPLVDAIAQIHLEGDITPRSWYKHICYQTIKTEQCKADRLAIDILSDIVYWYRPSEVRDEITGEFVGWKRKFTGEILKRSPDAFADALNATVRCVRESMRLLENLGLITVVIKPVKTPYGVIPNVMHIEVVPEAIAKITHRVSTKEKAETIEKSLLTKWVTRNDEMGNDLNPNSEQVVTFSALSEYENGNLSIYRDLKEISSETSPPTPQGGEKEQGFGFQIPEDSTPNSLASLRDAARTLEFKSEPLQLTTNQSVEAIIPPPPKTDKFFTGKPLNQQKYERWASAAHPALVYAGEETPWLEPPSGSRFVVFNKNFVDWHSFREMEQYGKDKERASADFQGGLRNDPERCATRWEEYQKHMVRHAASAAARVNNGIEITEAEKQKFAKHQRAFVGVTSDSTENIDQRILNAAKPIKSAPQLESVATVNDDAWDTIEEQANQWEEQQQSEGFQNVPEDADNPWAYQEVVKSEDRDYYAKIHQARFNPQAYSTPVTSADVREQVRQATQRMSMATKNIKAAKLEERRIAFWNNQLKSGDANAIAITTKQATDAGYRIVDGQVEDVEF